MFEKSIEIIKKMKYDLVNPQTIQEKLFWLKLFDNNELKEKCSDKLFLGKYSEEKIGEDLSVPKIKIYSSPDELNFSELPEKFLLKCNHGSGFNLFIDDKKKFSENECRRQLIEWLDTDYSKIHDEPFYANITRKSYVEEWLGDNVLDYKFWCFNGIPKLYTINGGHGHGRILYFGMDKTPRDYYRILKNPNETKKFKQPLNFSKMVEYSKIFAKDFKFVRVDFYEVGNKLYLGELTFCPGAGIYRYSDRKYDLEVGKMLTL